MAAWAGRTMRKSGDYRARLEQIDGKLRRARQGRGRRREQMLMLLDQLESQYQRQKQELTGAWAEIDRLETMVEELQDRLEKIADEFEKDTRQTDELISRIARMDGVLKHIVKVRRTEPQESQEPQAAVQAPAARPMPVAKPAPSDQVPPPDVPPPRESPTGQAGDATLEQERRMPHLPADLSTYGADPKMPSPYAGFLDKRA